MTRRVFYNIIVILILILFYNLFFVYFVCADMSNDSYVCTGSGTTMVDITPRWHCERDGFIYGDSYCFFGYMDSYSGRCWYTCYPMSNCYPATANVIEDKYQNSTYCPSMAKWKLISDLRSDDAGCMIQRYMDTTGVCGYIYMSNCSDDVLSNSSAYTWNEVFHLCIGCPAGQVCPEKCVYTWDELRQSIAENNITSAEVEWSGVDAYNVEGNNTQVNLGGYSVNAYGGISGNATVDNIQGSDERIIGDILSAIQVNTANTVAAIESLRRSIGQYSSSGSVSVGSLASNSSVSGGDNSSALYNLLNIHSVDGVNPDSVVVDNSTVSITDFDTDLDLPDDYTEVTNSTFDFVDDVIQNSPITSVIAGTGVQVESPVCKIDFTLYGKDMSLDFCKDTVVNFLQTLGGYIVAIASIYGIYLIFI